MEEMRKEYILLFNGISETVAELEGLVQRLKRFQQAAENCYLDRGEPMGVIDLDEVISVERKSPVT